MGNELLNYMNPPIPKGFHYVEGKWNTGFVIARDIDQSEFIWIPVGYLEANGTSNGVMYNERFGRRNWYLSPFSQLHPKFFHENTSKELIRQNISVSKHGGFYISRYNISLGREDKLQSKALSDNTKKISVSINEAVKLARSFDENVPSHLPYGKEYDSVLEFEKKCFDNGFVMECSKHIFEQSHVGVIYYRYTQEKYDGNFFVARGNEPPYNSYHSFDSEYYIPTNAYRYIIKEEAFKNYDLYSFQIVLCIDHDTEYTYLN